MINGSYEKALNLTWHSWEISPVSMDCVVRFFPSGPSIRSTRYELAEGAVQTDGSEPTRLIVAGAFGAGVTLVRAGHDTPSGEEGGSHVG